MKSRFKPSDILIGIIFTLFLISFGVWLAVHFRPLYYFDVDHLNIPEYSGYSREVVLENYNALIDYCSPFYSKSLHFPTLPASESGISHFAEVKVIFNVFFYMGILCLLLLVPVVIYKHRKKDISYLKASALTSVILPAAVGGACAVNFDKAFVVFHRIFFRNDDWLFDPAADPVILILPETYFLHCAVLIIGTVIAGSLILYLVYRLGLKRRQPVQKKG